MTIRQQRNSLELLSGLARFKADGLSCPGEDVDQTTEWYTLSDKAVPIPLFDICQCDVRRIELIFPALRVFSKDRMPEQRKRKCNFRVESKHLPRYLDLLAQISADAEARRRPPDMQPFIEHVLRDRRFYPCTRDDLVADQTWHFAGDLPSFTICGECYHSFAAAFADGSPSVAGRIARTPRRVVDEARSVRGVVVQGTSCQLYSPRMRKIFRKAVQRDDFAYLARKVIERKEVEVESQAGAAVLLRALKELDRAATKGDKRRAQDREKEKLERELADLVADWRTWE